MDNFDDVHVQMFTTHKVLLECVCTHLHACIRAYMCVCVCVRPCMHLYVCVCTYLHEYVHVHVCMYVRACVCTCVSVCVQSCTIYCFFSFAFFSAVGKPLRSFLAFPQATMSSSSSSSTNFSLVKKLSKNTWWFFPLSRRVKSFTLSKLLLATVLYQCKVTKYRSSHCGSQQVPIPTSNFRVQECIVCIHARVFGRCMCTYSVFRCMYLCSGYVCM